jgi:hypothetical protein
MNKDARNNGTSARGDGRDGRTPRGGDRYHHQPPRTAHRGARIQLAQGGGVALRI